MTKYERENWIINIENTAAAVAEQYGNEVVESVFQCYHVVKSHRSKSGSFITKISRAFISVHCAPAFSSLYFSLTSDSCVCNLKISFLNISASSAVGFISIKIRIPNVTNNIAT